jgi:hypothetical protein
LTFYLTIVELLLAQVGAAFKMLDEEWTLSKNQGLTLVGK